MFHYFITYNNNKLSFCSIQKEHIGENKAINETTITRSEELILNKIINIKTNISKYRPT